MFALITYPVITTYSTYPFGEPANIATYLSLTKAIDEWRKHAYGTQARRDAEEVPGGHKIGTSEFDALLVVRAEISEEHLPILIELTRTGSWQVYPNPIDVVRVRREGTSPHIRKFHDAVKDMESLASQAQPFSPHAGDVPPPPFTAPPNSSIGSGGGPRGTFPDTPSPGEKGTKVTLTDALLAWILTIQASGVGRTLTSVDIANNAKNIQSFMQVTIDILESDNAEKQRKTT